MAAGCNCDRAILTDGQSTNQRRPRLTGYALERWTTEQGTEDQVAAPHSTFTYFF